jgi:hypothetical protein
MQTTTTISPNGNFGDIMSFSHTFTKSERGSLSQFTALERILLTANGNLQRILSAYFLSPIEVKIHNNTLTSLTPLSANFERLVTIVKEDGKLCCTASSTVVLSDSKVIKLVMEENIGIGQLFRHLNILPEFKLQEVGRDDKGMYRDYTLTATGIICAIHEEFPIGLFD